MSSADPRRVVFVQSSSLPWVTGGMEIYAHSLAVELRECGWRPTLVVHHSEWARTVPGVHDVEGVEIVVLPALAPSGRLPSWGCRAAGVAGFQELLADLRPGLVHLHDFSAAAGLGHLDLAAQAGARTMLTYHSPGQTCAQRELLEGGERPCDGENLLARCTRCRIAASRPGKVGRWLGRLAATPLPVPERWADAPSPLARLATARLATRAFHDAVRSLRARVDLVHVYADWARALFLRNGFSPEQLVLVRTGLPRSIDRPVPRAATPSAGPLRLVAMGRCDRTKGFDVLCRAMQSLPADVQVSLDLIGPYFDREAEPARTIRAIAGAEPRVRLRGPLPHAELVQRLPDYDACVVPSRWLETGPLVVLEAFGAGLPVLGSDLGGIAELVRPGVDGLLVPSDSPRALAASIERLGREPGLLDRLRAGVRPPRTMHDVAAELAAVYEDLLSR